MPKAWYDRHTVNEMEDGDEKRLYRSIVADKKPYFMRYIYPALMKQYNTYIKNTNHNALREFALTVDELRALPPEKQTERQREFLRYYDYRMPVGVSDCAMNSVCRKFEQAFDGHIKRHNVAVKFDYSILRSDAEYTNTLFNAIKRLYTEYDARLKDYATFMNYERIDKYDAATELDVMNKDFLRACAEVCPDERVLCNIVLDLCYNKNSAKRFAWAMCGKTIIQNLLENNGNKISFPKLDPNGDIYYCGNRYSVMTKEIEVRDGDCTE